MSGDASFQETSPARTAGSTAEASAPTTAAQDIREQEIEYQRQYAEMQQRQQAVMTETQYYALMLLDMLNTANTAWVIII